MTILSMLDGWMNTTVSELLHLQWFAPDTGGWWWASAVLNLL